MKGIKLTEKQKRFCEEYLKDYNATQAYKRAGYSVRSEITAKVEGSKLLTKPNVQSYIEALSKKVSEKAEIKIEKVIKEISLIAFANIQDYYDDKGTMKEIHELTREQARCVESIVPLKDGGFKIKLHDKNASLEKLMKYLGGYELHNKQKVGESTIDYSQLPTEVLEQILNATKKE